MPGQMQWTMVDRLVKMFRERGLVPGDKVPGEVEISASFGVSRPVVREAFSVLEAAGLIAVRKGSGRVLMPFGFGSVMGLLASCVIPRGKLLLDLLAIRQVIETNMFAAAAAAMSTDDLDGIERVVRIMEEKAARGEYFGVEDRQFHALLYHRLDNEVLQGLLDLFWTLYDGLDPKTLVHSQRLDETAAHHRRIVEGLKAGDVRRAQHYLERHFYDTGYALAHSSLDGVDDDLSDKMDPGVQK